MPGLNNSTALPNAEASSVVCDECQRSKGGGEPRSFGEPHVLNTVHNVVQNDAVTSINVTIYGQVIRMN